ncbi:cryptochrome/photolyase family protein [Oceanomicrobium pacificus]|uniref:Deoxyribodipyrimidine photo-lyase n=1 Tax=Oceanomicrobium pacificus TaxID=2692916 RepID=A0A6B0TRK0_9RHOB|nr:deoxyribodipyrimidine photo-lyase [Oceanomicrobium pacificus]MXU66586.1 deoxyribodipyrimidine photo-lyase [Oceanomicrobium pacificus]
MSTTSPTLVWFRRDFRLDDNGALAAAAEKGGPVVPVFILDPDVDQLGAAPAWRLEQAIEHFGAVLEGMGSRLILRRGKALDMLRDLVAETGAGAVHWNRYYQPQVVARDREVKAALKEDGLEACSFDGMVLRDPWEVRTQSGDPYRVYSPFWKSLRGMDIPAPRDPPGALPAPDTWPESERLADWGLGGAMNRGAEIVAGHARIGEAAARDRLDEFLDGSVARYAADRNRLDRPDATSGLSEPLAWGEISPRRIFHTVQGRDAAGTKGAEKFLSELGWRDFAWHIHHSFPALAEENWSDGWDNFPWREENDDAEAWQRGLTGEEMVDAAMRELYVTGRMHNRARMLVASYLTKHYLVHWRVGLRWFEHCLIDWDPASNGMGWQWVAGSGPDAAPYFRVFNPALQAEKFDPKGSYRRLYLDPEADGANAFLRAVPRSWGLGEGARPDTPRISLKDGRDRALGAYEAMKSGRGD